MSYVDKIVMCSLIVIIASMLFIILRYLALKARQEAEDIALGKDEIICSAKDIINIITIKNEAQRAYLASANVGEDKDVLDEFDVYWTHRLKDLIKQ